MDQPTLNKEMLAKGRQRYRRRVEDAKKRNMETANAHGRRLLSESILPYLDVLKAWLKNSSEGKPGKNHLIRPLIDMIDPGITAFIAAQCVLNSISQDRTYNATCVFLGSLLEDETRFRFIQKNEPVLWEKLQYQFKNRGYNEARKRTITVLTMNQTEKGDGYKTKAKGLKFRRWSRVEKAKVGATLIELFKDSTGLIMTFNQRESKNKTVKYITATKKTFEWIDKYHKDTELLEPYWLPMVEQPKDWTSNTSGGGYELEEIPIYPLVKQRDWNYQHKVLPIAEIPQVIKAINSLQQTAYKVNEEVFRVLEHFWEQGNEFADLPAQSLIPYPEKPHDIETNKESRLRWRIDKSLVIKENHILNSKRIQVKKTLWMANKFLKEPKIYYPHQMDFRGRTYSIAHFMQPQGCDWQRALLKFAEGKRINHQNEIDWLAVYGSNLWGNDKVTFEDRAEWTRKNEFYILESAHDPLNITWWADADEPWQFLAWCFEWAKFKKYGKGFLTTLPIALDASNNGLQILSLLTRDERGGAATNCVQVKDTPADIYQDVADEVLKNLGSIPLRGDVSDLQKSVFWLDFGINRKACKRPVMVLPYGGTFFSCAGYIKEWFKDGLKDRKIRMDKKLIDTYSTFLAHRVWEAIKVCVGRPRNAMDWLREAARIMCKHELPLLWTTPTGLPVQQKYLTWKSKRIKTALGNKVLRITVSGEYDFKMNRRRQLQGISPNFVHSLDAAAMHKTICMAKLVGIDRFTMIHDSYGVLAPDVDAMAASLRRVFSDMFSDDLLARLKEELESQLPEGISLPPLPEYGTLDPKDILESEFFFS